MKATDTSEPMELDADEVAAVLTIKGRNVDAAAAEGHGAAAAAASTESSSGTMHNLAIFMHRDA